MENTKIVIIVCSIILVLIIGIIIYLYAFYYPKQRAAEEKNNVDNAIALLKSKLKSNYELTEAAKNLICSDKDCTKVIAAADGTTEILCIKDSIGSSNLVSNVQGPVIVKDGSSTRAMMKFTGPVDTVGATKPGSTLGTKMTINSKNLSVFLVASHTYATTDKSPVRYFAFYNESSKTYYDMALYPCVDAALTALYGFPPEYSGFMTYLVLKTTITAAIALTMTPADMAKNMTTTVIAVGKIALAFFSTSDKKYLLSLFINATSAKIYINNTDITQSSADADFKNKLVAGTSLANIKGLEPTGNAIVSDNFFVGCLVNPITAFTTPFVILNQLNNASIGEILISDAVLTDTETKNLRNNTLNQWEIKP
jgi:hypothetical protein